MEGKYFNEGAIPEVKYDDDVLEDGDCIEHATLSCSMPSVAGRGFIEVVSASDVTDIFIQFSLSGYYTSARCHLVCKTTDCSKE